MKNTDIQNVYSSCLAINKMRLSVRLGYEMEERKTLQPVEVDIKLFFPELTSASLSDEGTFVCYDKISRLVHALCKNSEYRLIEYLGYKIYQKIRPVVEPEIRILVKITKCELPVEFVLGGASFTYTDLPPLSWVIPG